MPTKTATSTRTAGSLAVDRIEYRTTGRRTAAGNKPIAAVVVDGIELGEVAKANGSGWLYGGPGVTAPRYYLPATKPEAAAALVAAALAAGTIRDMDDEAAELARAAGALAEIAEHDADRRDEDNLSRAMRAAGALALRPGVREGDFVTTDDGRVRRVGHVHDAHEATRYHPAMPARVQLTDGGRFHLTESGMADYSGGFAGSVDVAHLVDTGETRQGSAWIWHHGRPAAGGSVSVLVPFRVFAVPTGVEVPRY